MENIFKDTKFGDLYKTRDGHKAIYLSTFFGGSENDKNNPPFADVDFAIEIHIKYTDGDEKYFHDIIRCDAETGKFNKWKEEPDKWDIVGKWEEPIDEEKLDDIAFNHYCKGCAYCEKAKATTWEERFDACHKTDCYRKDTVWRLMKGFKDGYRKAKEE